MRGLQTYLQCRKELFDIEPIDGSVVRALKIPFDRYLLIEKDERLAKKLKEEIKDSSKESIAVIKHDANKILPLYCERTKPMDRAVCFLDPYSTEVEWDTLRRYTLTCIDEVSDYALAMAAPKLNSQVARQFFEKCFRFTPFPIRQVVTDGGSEFKGEFDCLIEDSQMTCLWPYPKASRMNAACERFTDLELFNEKLADWLVKYNGVRPHKGLGLQTSVK